MEILRYVDGDDVYIGAYNGQSTSDYTVQKCEFIVCKFYLNKNSLNIW